MTTSLQLLQAQRINTIMQALQDTRLLPQQLRFLARTPLIPAVDGEIMASYQGYVYIADLIADDASAVAYNVGKFVTEATAVPNLKIGTPLTQAMLNQLNALVTNLASVEDRVMFLDWESRTIDSLLLGVRQRMEALIVAMHVGGFSYDRLGIKMTNVSWGRPSDLTITVSTPWSTAASATPVSDVWTARRTAQIRYGVTYDRITLSTQAFMYMIATDEFKAKALPLIGVGLTFANFSTENLQAMQALAEKVLGLSIELYDSRYWYQTGPGSILSAPFLPIVKVILSSSQDDNDPTAADFANGVVTESIVGSLASTSMVGNLGGARRGPLAYATVPPDLNPPNVTYWGVARGFPRLHRKQMSACLTVGSFSDTIAATEPSMT
jgi:hypothetical protein